MMSGQPPQANKKDEATHHATNTNANFKLTLMLRYYGPQHDHPRRVVCHLFQISYLRGEQDMRRISKTLQVRL